MHLRSLQGSLEAWVTDDLQKINVKANLGKGCYPLWLKIFS